MAHIDLKRYAREKLLKIVLFSFMEFGYCSVRFIQKQCETDIRFMWMLDEENAPSHMTISNFIYNELSGSLEGIFNDINSYMFDRLGVDLNHAYIDGTKIEANANKYTWIWKKSCIKSRNRIFENSLLLCYYKNWGGEADMGLRSKICFLNRHNTGSNEFKLHFHNCYEIIYFLSGEGTVILGDRSYPVSPNTYCIIPPNTEHTECLDGYGEILFIGFEYNDPNYIFQRGIHSPADTSILLLFNNIISEYKSQNPGYEIAAKALLDLLLVTSIRDTGAANKKCKDLDFIKSYIDQYFYQKINFGDLAALSGYSYDYFRNIFKKKFGISPQTYMIDKRLDSAKHLLKTSNLSCTEIAYRCGFSNSAQMTTMFKAKFGKSPTAYRITDSYKRFHKS